MKYAIKRHDGAIFPERYETITEAQAELNYKLGNGGGYGLAWIIQIIDRAFILDTITTNHTITAP